MKKNRLCLLALFFGISLLSGCANFKSMAWEDETAQPAEIKKPIFLMTTTFKNVYRPLIQPTMAMIMVSRSDKQKGTIFNVGLNAYVRASSAEEGNTYLLRMELDPGAYEIKTVMAQGMFFPVYGHFIVPMHTAWEAKEPGVYYLGHVTATVRQRREGEFRAGPVLPLLDQALSGASGGTFDVEITDDMTVDEARFRSKFPQLQGVPIKKMVLPAFDRAKAQKYWEEPS